MDADHQARDLAERAAHALRRASLARDADHFLEMGRHVWATSPRRAWDDPRRWGAFQLVGRVT